MSVSNVFQKQVHSNEKAERVQCHCVCECVCVCVCVWVGNVEWKPINIHTRLSIERHLIKLTPQLVNTKGRGKGKTDQVCNVQWHVSRWGCVNVVVVVIEIVVILWQWSVRLNYNKTQRIIRVRLPAPNVEMFPSHVC